MKLFRISLVLLAGFLLLPVAAQEPPAAPSGPDDTLIARGDSRVTHGEFDARMARIPSRDRLEFVRDGQQVDRMLNQLMINKTLADQARAAGFDKEDWVVTNMRLSADQELGKLWLDNLVENAPDADWDAMAMDLYAARKDQLRRPQTMDVSHILISTEQRPEEEALAKIREIQAELQADPSRFEELAMAWSEDPSKASNRGSFKDIANGQFVKPFEDAAKALQPGELSGPVKTDFGYHLIRLDAINPPRQLSFDEVKPRLVAAAQQQHRERLRAEILSEVHDQPLEIPQDAIRSMLQRYFGENLENAPDYSGGLGRGLEPGQQ